MPKTRETLADFFDERADWLEMRVINAPEPRSGYGVALVIDGTYMHREDAESIAKFFRNIFNATLRDEPRNYKEI